MSIGFIGCGNMAGAIIGGMVKSGAFAGEEIKVYDVFSPATEKAAEAYGVGVCQSEREIIKECETVILAVKPNVLGKVLDKINPTLEESDTLLISIAAGKSLEFMRNALSHNNRMIRVMPNINALAGEAISAYTANAEATQADKQLCEDIFSAVGQVLYLEETYFPVFGVLGGCGPAIAYLFIDALARAGVQNGMKKETALTVATQTVLGSARMIAQAAPDVHPWELIDRVCSPGGTTIEAITALQANGFEAAIHQAVNNAVEKDSKL